MQFIHIFSPNEFEIIRWNDNHILWPCDVYDNISFVVFSYIKIYMHLHEINILIIMIISITLWPNDYYKYKNSDF